MKNSRYTCLIIDDEPKAIELLTDSLRMVNRNIIVAETHTQWADALTAIRTGTFDLVFLDISIQGRNGMDLLRSVPDLQSEVIFVTAYSDHALNAFRFSAAGYLVKPVDEIELANVLDKALTRIEYRRQATQGRSAPHGRIGIPDNKSITYVDMADILYLEAHNTYTKVVTTDAELLSAYNLGRFRELLPEEVFCQIHRSYIVNMNHIRRYEHSGMVVLDNQKELPVAQSARSRFQTVFARVHPGDGRK